MGKKAKISLVVDLDEDLEWKKSLLEQAGMDATDEDAEDNDSLHDAIMDVMSSDPMSFLSEFDGEFAPITVEVFDE